jgi:catalase-peroxidase
VNPEGPGGNPAPLLAAQDIRETFARMAMNDEETVALIAGGHTFGKGHGAANPGKHVGPEPEGASVEEQGFGWKNSFGSGKGEHTITSGLEGAWTENPVKWDNGYFDNLFGYEWEQTKSPAGATLWVPTDRSTDNMVPDAHVKGKTHPPVMFTTDIALKDDPAYAPISKRFHEDPAEFADTFARAWYKLTHRDMGPHCRCLGDQVPAPQIWQDPVPAATGSLIGDEAISGLKRSIMDSDLAIGLLVRTAWGSASTFRSTDYRGGANGARIRLSPQKDWGVNDPTELAKVLGTLEKIQTSFNSENKGNGVAVSLADVIVLGGCAAIEAAASAAGQDVAVPFSPGRTDATAEQTDVDSFAVLEPVSDGFRNYAGEPEALSPAAMGAAPEALLVDKAHMLDLTKAEMTVLVGGLRVLGANAGNSDLGVLTKSPGTLTNDFFTNLLDMGTEWVAAAGAKDVYEGRDRSTGQVKWKASRVDLVFGSNSQLRAIVEYYACSDAENVFCKNFVAAWSKVRSTPSPPQTVQYVLSVRNILNHWCSLCSLQVMDLGRFDLN